jgi:hypothetical protein
VEDRDLEVIKTLLRAPGIDLAWKNVPFALRKLSVLQSKSSFSDHKTALDMAKDKADAEMVEMLTRE